MLKNTCVNMTKIVVDKSTTCKGIEIARDKHVDNVMKLRWLFLATPLLQLRVNSGVRGLCESNQYSVVVSYLMTLKPSLLYMTDW